MAGYRVRINTTPSRPKVLSRARIQRLMTAIAVPLSKVLPDLSSIFFRAPFPAETNKANNRLNLKGLLFFRERNLTIDKSARVVAGQRFQKLHKLALLVIG